MYILKCKCTRSIHIYPIDNGKCPFCRHTINLDMAISDLFDAPLSFLNEKLSEIDKRIETKTVGNALQLIDDVLEWAPGWKIGEIQQSGEIHWRKLLAKTGCSNDVELLRTGIQLQEYAAFNNAMQYANDLERPVYSLIHNAQCLINEQLEYNLLSHEADKDRLFQVRILNCENMLAQLLTVRLKLENDIQAKKSTCDNIKNENIRTRDNLLNDMFALLSMQEAHEKQMIDVDIQDCERDISSLFVQCSKLDEEIRLKNEICDATKAEKARLQAENMRLQNELENKKIKESLT